MQVYGDWHCVEPVYPLPPHYGIMVSLWAVYSRSGSGIYRGERLTWSYSATAEEVEVAAAEVVVTVVAFLVVVAAAVEVVLTAEVVLAVEVVLTVVAVLVAVEVAGGVVGLPLQGAPDTRMAWASWA